MFALRLLNAVSSRAPLGASWRSSAQTGVLIVTLLAIPLSGIGKEQRVAHAAAPLLQFTSVDMTDSMDIPSAGLSIRQIADDANRAASLNPSYITIDTYMDHASYMAQWVGAVRATGKHVWFRIHWKNWERTAGTSATMTPSRYLSRIATFISQHSSLFKPGDILDGCPEPESSPYWATTYGTHWTRQPAASNAGTAAFNRFLVDLTGTENAALHAAGVSGVITTVHATSAWFAENPALYGSTVSAMGNLVTIDRYPDQGTADPTTATNALLSLLSRIESYRPDVKIVIGEMGSANAIDVDDATKQDVLKAELAGLATVPYLVGLNYRAGAGTSSAAQDLAAFYATYGSSAAQSPSPASTETPQPTATGTTVPPTTVLPTATTVPPILAATTTPLTPTATSLPPTPTITTVLPVPTTTTPTPVTTTVPVTPAATLAPPTPAATTMPPTHAAASVTGADPSGQPMPVGDLPGWHQIFTDDFTTNAPLGSFRTVYGSGWTDYGDGVEDTAKHGQYWISKVVSVNGGMMNLYIHTENGVHMVAAPIPLATGAAQHGQLYGRYTVRWRSDSLPGYKTAWLLWPQSQNWPHDGELDFPEGDLDGMIGGAFHYQGGTSGTSQTVFRTSTNEASGWHTTTIEWTPSYINYILDGTVVAKLTNASEIPDTPMWWVLQTETATDGEVPNNTTAGNVQIDWVAVYSYRP